MARFSRPFVSSFLKSNRRFFCQVVVTTTTLVLRPLALVTILAIVPASLYAQGTGDVTDVHITPRANPDAATAVVTSGIGAPNIPSGGAGLKTAIKPLKVDVNLVLLPVTVTDPMNRLVTGLDRDNFSVLESSTGQQIRSFSSEDAPLSLGVIFDMSGSMGNKIDKSKQAVLEFFKTANPDDEFFLITFADKPELLVDFTSKIEEIQNQMVFANAKGRTALLDAIYLGINKMKQAHHEKKALLIISDGGDNRSRYTDNEIKSLVKEADVQIYSIGLFDNSPATTEERYGPYMLNEISETTGGRMFRVEDPNELTDVATKIGVELRNQYVLGYRPTNAARDGKWRKVKVKLNPPKGLPPLTVHAKTGYYAPSQ
jgi:Ca-activated chloride channel family protein